MQLTVTLSAAVAVAIAVLATVLRAVPEAPHQRLPLPLPLGQGVQCLLERLAAGRLDGQLVGRDGLLALQEVPQRGTVVPDGSV